MNRLKKRESKQLRGPFPPSLSQHIPAIPIKRLLVRGRWCPCSWQPQRLPSPGLADSQLRSAPRRGRKATLHLSTRELKDPTLSLSFFHSFTSLFFLLPCEWLLSLLFKHKRLYRFKIHCFKIHCFKIPSYQSPPSNHSICSPHHGVWRTCHPQKHPQTNGGHLDRRFPLHWHSLLWHALPVRWSEDWEAAKPSRTPPHRLHTSQPQDRLRNGVRSPADVSGTRCGYKRWDLLHRDVTGYHSQNLTELFWRAVTPTLAPPQTLLSLPCENFQHSLSMMHWNDTKKIISVETENVIAIKWKIQ